MGDANRLVLQVVADEDGDVEELDQLTQTLRNELLDLDVEAVDPLEEQDLPERAKGLGVLAGWLAVQFGSPEVLQALITAISGWAGRANRAVKVSFGPDVLEVTGVTSAQQEKIIEAWLERQSTSA